MLDTAPDTIPTVIDEILSGDSLSMSAARRVPAHRGNAACAVASTIWRWHKKGTRTPDGRRVYLEMARIGGKWMTSLAALKRFLLAQMPPAVGEAAPAPKPRTTRQRQTAVERAGKRLAELGA